MKLSMLGNASLLLLASLGSAVPSGAQETDDGDPETVTLPDALECRLTAPRYNGFALSIGGKDGIAARRKWRPVKSRNPFMNEYELPAPVTVAGGHETRRIGFTASAIVAVLDLPDPADLARAEGIANLADPEPLIAQMLASGKVTRAQVEAEMPTPRFMGERILVDAAERLGEGEEYGTHTVVARTISTVSTHPGTTLYGCSYRIEVTDRDGNAL